MSEPIVKINDRGVSVAIFKFENEGRDSYSAIIQRSYKKKGADDWVREELHCFDADLLTISNACLHAYNSLVDFRANSKKASYPTTPVVQEAETDSIPF